MAAEHLDRAWRYLTKAARERRTVTFGELGQEIGLIARTVGAKVLDPIREHCRSQDPPLPPLTCIVVNRASGLPSSGCGVPPDQVAKMQELVFGFDWAGEPNPFSSEPGAPRPRVVDDEPGVAGDPCAGIDVPSFAQLQKAVDSFDAQWGGVDEVLYETCERLPDDLPRALMTQSILIDRAYSAGLDRQVGVPKGCRSVDRLFAFAGKHAAEVVGLIHELDGKCEPLTMDALREVVLLHGRLCSLLSESLTDGDRPRSFVSKLLHFHCRIVPIMDSDCDGNVRKRAPHPVPLSFKRPAEADTEYFGFCQRFYRFYLACRTVRPGTTVKDLDAFLWTPPGFPGWDC